MSNTLTPRTDYLDAQLTFRANFDDDSGTDYRTMASLARQLERELAEAQRRLDELSWSKRPDSFAEGKDGWVHEGFNGNDL